MKIPIYALTSKGATSKKLKSSQLTYTAQPQSYQATHIDKRTLFLLKESGVERKFIKKTNHES